MAAITFGQKHMRTSMTIATSRTKILNILLLTYKVLWVEVPDMRLRSFWLPCATAHGSQKTLNSYQHSAKQKMKKSLMQLFKGLSWLPIYWRMASRWHMTKIIISLRSTISCIGGWNLRMIWKLAWHHTRCVRTCRRRWNNQSSHLSSQNILSSPLPYGLCLLIILTTFS